MNMDDHSNSQAFGTSSNFGQLGLVCHYQFENGSSQLAFFNLKDSGVATALDRSLCFSTDSFVQVLATSGAFILLSSYSADQTCYNVFNPLTKDSLLIPQPPCVVGRIVGAGLASPDECQFKVVLVEELYSSPNELVFHIFNSYTLEWTYQPADLSAAALVKLEFQEIGTTSPVYSDGAIHWKMDGHLLVYHVEGKDCDLYELPTSSEDWSTQLGYRSCLCESRGYVYYCHSDYDGLHVWGLIKDDDRYGSLCSGFDIDLERFRWRLVHSISGDVFSSRYHNSCGHFVEWEPHKVAPITYSDQAQIIYLQLPGTVVSFGFSTRDLRSICRYSYPGFNFDCCSFFPSIASGFCHQPREMNLLLCAEKELTLPVTEAANLSL